MSFYNLSASPDLATKECNYAFWNDGFTQAEIDKIVEIGDGYVTQNAEVFDGRLNEDVRKSQVSWLSLNNETTFIYDKLGYIIRRLNGEFFDLGLSGFVEDIQYTVYGEGGDHYDWHMDKGNLNSAPRKLSVVLQLSDPSEYEGGDLEFFLGGSNIIKADKKRGIVYAFPSYIIHRVTPVTSGIRKSLVAWIAGPKFK